MTRKSTDELAGKLEELLDSYCGRISLAEAVGVLVIQAVEIVMNTREMAEADEDGDEG